MRAILNALFIIFHPEFWIMNSRYSKDWDRKLRNLMEHYKFYGYNGYNGYRVRIKEYEMWIGNYPYASFEPLSPVKVDICPSRLTIY